MNPYLSIKIKNVSLLCVALVALLHSYNFSSIMLEPKLNISNQLNYTSFIECFFSNGICVTAVPIFALISGYLFYLTYKLTLPGYFYKVKSRILSLVIPFLLWTILSFLFCSFFWNWDIACINTTKVVLKQLGPFGTFFTGPNFQFWYIGQLLIFVVISPIIYLLLKCKVTRPIYLIALFFLWYTGVSSYRGIVTEPLFFYSLGACLEISKHEELLSKKIGKRGMSACIILWFLLLLSKTVLCSLKISSTIILATLFMHKTMILVGIITIWLGMDYLMLSESSNKFFSKFTCHSFFIFCFHEPFLDILKSIIDYLKPTPFCHLILFFTLPAFTIVSAIVISSLLLKHFSILHNLLSGNRGSKKTYRSIRSN